MGHVQQFSEITRGYLVFWWLSSSQTANLPEGKPVPYKYPNEILVNQC